METVSEQMEVWVNMLDKLVELGKLNKEQAIETILFLFDHNLRTTLEMRDDEEHRKLISLFFKECVW